MNKEQDNQRVDNKQQPMKYQQFVPGSPIGPPGQRQPQQDRSGRPGQGPGRPGQGPGRPGQGPGRPGQGPGRPGQGPGRPSSPPGQIPGIPQGPPEFGPSRPTGQPPSAPPTFTPQLPRGDEQQLSGPSGLGRPFGGGIDFRRGPRDFRGCLNRFTYIWLINGNRFWFYPVFIGRNTIEGFRWRRNRWEYDRIFTNRILFHLCF